MATHNPHLILERLSEGSWRLCDQALTHHDAGYLVAYVEQHRHGEYEVTWIAHGVGTSAFPSLDELMQAAVVQISGPRHQPGTKPIPIPHMPPRPTH